jgi:maltose alpha-D-glucosyltransferase/alpha-amylase
VLYSLDLETFMDANGDGVGDFEGLTSRLEYLHALGIETIWLSPFHPSPNRDNGYDISDYYGVDPRHGSSGDFVEFMHHARKCGIKVIMDLVVNHTSNQHRWFQTARRNKESAYRSWYVWSSKRPSDWNQGMVFPGVQKGTWTYDKEAHGFFFHRFYEFQPDLNVDNPEVRSEIRRIMGYWLELGVAGFRIDAVPFIIESPAPGKKKPVMHYEYLSEMRKFLQWRSGDAILLGEANILPKETRRYFGEHDDGIHMMFNFFVNQYVFYALATSDIQPLVKALHATKELPGTGQWCQFLRNHDELDLGRLTPNQRAKVYARFGPEKRMQLYDRGIRRRLAPMLGDRRHMELANSLLFSLPGTPVLRYGDEIGMGDDLTLKERDAVRTPMQWSNDAQAGFSRANRTIHPVIDSGMYGYQHINVEAQRRDPGSLLNWTARMIRLRKECPEIGWGNWTILPTGSSHVLGMRYDWRGRALVLVHNFDEKAQEIQIRPEVKGGERLVNLLAEEESHSSRSGVHKMAIDSYGYRWFRVGELHSITRRKRA